MKKSAMTSDLTIKVIKGGERMQPSRIRVQVKRNSVRVTALGKANRGAMFVLSDVEIADSDLLKVLARPEVQRVIIGDAPSAELIP